MTTVRHDYIAEPESVGRILARLAEPDTVKPPPPKERRIETLVIVVVVAAMLAYTAGMVMARRVPRGGTGGFVNPLAYATLTRYGSSPVLTRGGVGTWDYNTVAGQQVFWDTRLQRWVMVYGGLDKPTADGGIIKIGLAYSDNLTSWTKEATNPVFTATAGDVMTATGNIVQVSANSYRLYHQVYPGSNFFTLATSTNMLTWTDQGHVFGLGTTGQWDDNAIFDPHPVLIGSTTHLWYGGQKTSDSTRGIGLATSTDGTTFTRQGRLFVPEAGEANRSFGAPALLVTSATDYKVFHDVALTGSDQTRFLDRHDTTNGSTFTHTHQMLVANPSGWDSVQVFDPAPVVRFGVLYLFYAGSATTGDALGLSPDIGLATMRWP